MYIFHFFIDIILMAVINQEWRWLRTPIYPMQVLHGLGTCFRAAQR